MSDGDPGNAEILEFIEAANRARRQTRSVRDPAPNAEARLEQLYRVSQRLAVYGTLAPGRSNHHVVAPYGGTWTTGRVRGDLVQLGWGAAAGYPALRVRADGPWVRVHVLESTRLPAAWPDIDAFEGREYRRILVPVHAEHDDEFNIIVVANLYESAD